MFYVSSVVRICLFVVSLAASCGLVAQCNLDWQPAGGMSGTDDVVFTARTWDPDGAGPRTPIVVLGGRFSMASNVLANRIATYDPATGQVEALGVGFDDDVLALAVLPNGDLVAAGAFTSSGGTAVLHVARWDGANWQPMASGLDGDVLSLTTLSGGDLVAGGRFDLAGATQVGRVARWNGSAWSSMGFGSIGEVVDMSPAPNGDLYVAGNFQQAGGAAAAGKACWSAGVWAGFGGSANGPVCCVQVMPGGDVIVAGNFDTIGSVIAVRAARWNGAQWTAMSSGWSGPEYPQELSLSPAGELFVGLTFFGGVKEWDGQAWVPTVRVSGGLSGSQFGTVHAIVRTAPQQLFVAGDFRQANAGLRCRFVLLITNTIHIDIMGERGFAMPVLDISRGPDGGVWALGHDMETSYSQWQDGHWSWLGTVSSTIVGNAIGGMPGDTAVVAGHFNYSIYDPYFPPRHFSCAMRQVGSAFGYVHCASPSPPPWGATGYSTLALRDGRLLFGHGGRVGRWIREPGDTSGGFPCSFDPKEMTELADGRLAASDGSAVYVQTPTGWNLIGTISGDVHAMAGLADGSLAIGGLFGSVNGQTMPWLARWDGSSWAMIGGYLNGGVHAMVALPNGELIVGGGMTLAAGQPAAHIARWDGAAWSGIGAGTNGPVLALEQDIDGVIWVGGDFTTAGGRGAPYTARLVPTCPASAEPFGVGCVGAGGANRLVHQTLPWLESRFYSRATGLPGNAISFEVLGFAPLQLPLNVLLPYAGANCDLVTFPDILEAHLPSNGQLDLQRAMPATATAVGTTFLQQVVTLEVGGGVTFVGAASSNALLGTIGALR